MNLRMPAEGLHGPENHALSADPAILLWSASAGTKTATGRDEDGCVSLRFRHGTQINDGFGWREPVAHCPYHAMTPDTERWHRKAGCCTALALVLGSV